MHGLKEADLLPTRGRQTDLSLVRFWFLCQMAFYQGQGISRRNCCLFSFAAALTISRTISLSQRVLQVSKDNLTGATLSSCLAALATQGPLLIAFEFAAPAGQAAQWIDRLVGYL